MAQAAPVESEAGFVCASAEFLKAVIDDGVYLSVLRMPPPHTVCTSESGFAATASGAVLPWCFKFDRRAWVQLSIMR